MPSSSQNAGSTEWTRGGNFPPETALRRRAGVLPEIAEHEPRAAARDESETAKRRSQQQIGARLERDRRLGRGQFAQYQ